jgi:EmrB/QacA subfamily drug resistance transporter
MDSVEKTTESQERQSSGGPSPGRLLFLACIPIFAVMLDTSILYVAFPAIRATYPKVSTEHLSWVLNAYTIMVCALIIPGGSSADRYGRKRLFLLGLLGFTLGSLLSGLAPSSVILILGRAVQGMGSAILLPTTLAFILAGFPKEKRAVAISSWGAVGALAAALGPALGSVIIQALGWRWAFFINLPIGLYCWLAARRHLREAHLDPNAPALPLLDVALSILGISLLSLGLVEIKEWGWRSRGVLSSLGVGFGLVVFFIVRNFRARVPLVDPALFRSRNFIAANSATFVFSIVFSAMWLGFVLFLKDVWRYSTLQTGLALTVGPLAVIPSAILSGKYASKHGHAGPILVGGVLNALGAIIRATTVDATPNFLTLWLPAALLGGFGGGMVFPSLAAAATFDLPPARFAVGSGVNNAIRQLGGVFGIAFTVVCLGTEKTLGLGSFPLLFWFLASGAMLVAVIGAAIRTVPRTNLPAQATATDSRAVSGPALENPDGSRRGRYV